MPARLFREPNHRLAPLPTANVRRCGPVAEKEADPNAFMQLMYEQNSEWDDVNRLEDERISVINAEVSAVQNLDPQPQGTVETLQRKA